MDDGTVTISDLCRSIISIQEEIASVTNEYRQFEIDHRNNMIDLERAAQAKRNSYIAKISAMNNSLERVLNAIKK